MNIWYNFPVLPSSGMAAVCLCRKWGIPHVGNTWDLLSKLVPHWNILGCPNTAQIMRYWALLALRALEGEGPAPAPQNPGGSFPNSCLLTFRSWRVSRAAISDVLRIRSLGKWHLLCSFLLKRFSFWVWISGSSAAHAPARSQGCSASHLGCRGVQFSSANRNDLKYRFPVLS